MADLLETSSELSRHEEPFESPIEQPRPYDETIATNSSQEEQQSSSELSRHEESFESSIQQPRPDDETIATNSSQEEQQSTSLESPPTEKPNPIKQYRLQRLRTALGATSPNDEQKAIIFLYNSNNIKRNYHGYQKFKAEFDSPPFERGEMENWLCFISKHKKKQK